MLLKTICVLLALLGPLAADAADKPIRVYVLAGQSNMAGSGKVSQAPEAWQPLDGVLFDETRPDQPASFSSDWEIIGEATNNMGPEMGFAAMMRDAYPDETIAIIKVSRGATGLGYWRTPGSLGHDTLMARIDTISSRLDAAVADTSIPSWSFEGFVWMQGENEADGALGPSQSYEADFNDLATKVRTQTGVADLPVVLARISIQLDPSLGGPVNQPQLDNVRAAQMAWPVNDGHGAWVDTDDLSLIDSWHFGSYGQLTLGQRFAQAWLGLVDPRPLLLLTRATGQPDKTNADTIIYEAVFSAPVSGFDAADISLLGDTGANGITVTETAPLDGTTYQISVTGMSQPGRVDLVVDDAAANALAGGLPSLPGLGEETAVLWTPHSGVTDLLVYDPFSPEARPLLNLQSGTGWDGAGWDIQNDRTGYTSGDTGNFDYPGLISTPAHGTGGDTYVSSARALDLEKTFAPYMTARTAGAVDLPGTTFWLSYLVHPLNASQPQRVALLRGTGSTYNNNTVNVYQSGGTWRLLVLSSEIDTSIPVAADQTYLMVLRLHVGGDSSSSSAHLWINPDESSLGGADPDLATATTSQSLTSADFKFSRLHWYPGSQPNYGKLDEIRLGTTFASVTPTIPPELIELPAITLVPDIEGQLVFSFFRERADLTYTVLESFDFVEWDPVAVNPGNVGEQVVLTFPAPDPKCFYRLQVSY